jgi:hypothetical protein
MIDARARQLGLLAKLVIAFAMVLALAAILWHGLSLEELQRLWDNLVQRPSGPMRFRFVLQPSMAAIVAIHDGLGDARTGRTPYFITVLRNPQERAGRLREGLNATARIILLGLAMDVVYQLVVLRTFYPNEALIIALLLAFVPYVLIRGLVVRVWRRLALAGRVR